MLFVLQLEEHKVDVFFNGHNHCYERTYALLGDDKHVNGVHVLLFCHARLEVTNTFCQEQDMWRIHYLPTMHYDYSYQY